LSVARLSCVRPPTPSIVRWPCAACRDRDG
jgi:hypothetical protein